MENEQTAQDKSSKGSCCGHDGMKHKCHGGGGGAGGSCAGGVWFIGWLFTIGLLHPTFWKGVLALVTWPYNLGAFFR